MITKVDHLRWRLSGSVKRGDAVFEYAPGYFWNDGTQPRGPYRSVESAQQAMEWEREQNERCDD